LIQKLYSPLNTKATEIHLKSPYFICTKIAHNLSV